MCPTGVACFVLFCFVSVLFGGDVALISLGTMENYIKHGTLLTQPCEVVPLVHLSQIQGH